MRLISLINCFSTAVLMTVVICGCAPIQRMTYRGDGQVLGNLLLFPTFEVRLGPFDVVHDGHYTFDLDGLPPEEYYVTLGWTGVDAPSAEHVRSRIAMASSNVTVRLLDSKGKSVFIGGGLLTDDWGASTVGSPVVNYGLKGGPFSLMRGPYRIEVDVSTTVANGAREPPHTNPVWMILKLRGGGWFDPKDVS